MKRLVTFFVYTGGVVIGTIAGITVGLTIVVAILKMLSSV